jgi:hypothetical protein
MANGTFNGVASPYVRDWEREEFYRQQEESRRERDHTLRAAQWFAGQLVGLPLHSEQQTHTLCRELAETMYGDRVSDLTTVIRKAATLCWLAEVQRATTDPLPVPEVTEQPRTVIYRPAA